MKKVAIFMGTRPEGIKMAPVVKAVDAREGLESIVVSTGQHKEMLQQVVELFDINVDHDLEVMLPNQTLPILTSRLITRIDALLEETQPDMALVQGGYDHRVYGGLVLFLPWNSCGPCRSWTSNWKHSFSFS